LRFKPDNDYRVANKVANSRQVYFPSFHGNLDYVYFFN
jgi:hypothetical protein